ncbi:MAG: lysine--tRNA ligase [bacterium]|nr:lysine--tRNA ligase [bacterium]
MSLEEIRNTRIEKSVELRNAGIVPYPPISARTHAIGTACENFDALSQSGEALTIAGRIILKREHGGSTFFHVADETGRMQGYAKKDVLGSELYAQFIREFDVGDIIEASGTLFTTKKGEKTLAATRITMLAKSLRPLPEKWHGLADVEERYRKRYLDLIMNPEARDNFVLRSRILQGMREFFLQAGFLEVETPMLHTIAGGALAKPFKTRMDTLDLELYLRIAPELYLKRLLVGGFERVFEMGKSFRNEGMDKEHNPEFTEPEAYIAYKDYEWLMGFTENLFLHLARLVGGKDDSSISFMGQTLDFTTPWPRFDLNDLVREHTGLDFWENSEQDFSAKARDLGITVEKTPTKAALLDEIYKKVIRPGIQNPTFIVNHPIELSPLAKTHRSDPRKVERFQLLVGGMEVVNAFSELNDPEEQRRRFVAQIEYRKKGDAEAHPMDEDYIEALEYGMPPAAGIGIGADRVVRLFTDSASLREVLLFPTMKPR